MLIPSFRFIAFLLYFLLRHIVFSKFSQISLYASFINFQIMHNRTFFIPTAFFQIFDKIFSSFISCEEEFLLLNRFATKGVLSYFVFTPTAISASISPVTGPNLQPVPRIEIWSKLFYKVFFLLHLNNLTVCNCQKENINFT